MKKSVYDTDNDSVVDNSEKLEGSTKAGVQNHTPKSHTLGSHSTKDHSELESVGANDHHNRLHAIDDVLDHSGVITDTQHGTKTSIPNAHHTPPTVTQTKALTRRVLSIRGGMYRVLNLTNQTASIGATDLDLSSYINNDGDDVFLYGVLSQNSGAGTVGANVFPVRLSPPPTFGLLIRSVYQIRDNGMMLMPTNVSGNIRYNVALTGSMNYNFELYIIGYATDIPNHDHDI